MRRLSSPTVRLRLTMLYGGLFFLSGLVLVAISYLFFRDAAGVNLIVPTGSSARSNGPDAETELRFHEAVARSTDVLHQGLLRAVIVLALMTLISIALGWLVAGMVLRPLRSMTATTRQISEHNMDERLAVTGPRDELRDLADTIDGLLARLQTHVAEQQRFAANASHELRTPLATTQALLDVAHSDPKSDDGRLVERLQAVNSRAIDLTEALLLLSRTDQRSFGRDQVDLSLIVEEATESLLPLAAERGVAIETAAGAAPTVGSQALLSQLAANLVRNAIVHNLPEGGAVWVITDARPQGIVLTVENTGEELAPDLVATLTEPFLRGTERIHTDHTGVGLGLAIVKSIVEAHEGSLTLAPRAGGGLSVTAQLPNA